MLGPAREVDMRALAVYVRGLAVFMAGIVVGTLMMQPSAAQENKNTGLTLNHVGIAVKDFPESLNFYTKVMGFRVAYAMPSPDGKPTTTFLQINRDTFLEMAPANANTPPGITHIGILSDDVSATITLLRQTGATVADARAGGPTGSRLSNITDPNGIRLELVEQPPSSLMRKAMEAWK
jgi:catechol 2,3-dioxygenase-like lactoylglutathione lyase family enzyme